MNTARPILASFALAACFSSACDENSPAASSSSAATSSAPKSASAKPSIATSASASRVGPATSTSVTLLITADENGYLLPASTEEGAVGGAAEMLSQWITKEGHCPADPCPAPRSTIVLSAGDHWGGPAIPSFFGGEPTAAVMRRMHYDVSAFGNHEVDFGKEQFAKNVTTGGFDYVAANMKATSDAKMLDLAPYKVVERNGAKIAVVGLASIASVQTTMANRLDGVAVGGYASALEAAIPKAWSDGADAVVVLAHECPDMLRDLVKPDWNVTLVTGAHCKKDVAVTAGKTRFVSPGRHFERYLRVKLAIDKSKPPAERAKIVDEALVENKGAKADPTAAKGIAEWKAKLDADLGENIGFSREGINSKDARLGRWLAEGLRSETGADVGIINKTSLRQSLPKGAITKSTVYSIIPFENSAMIVTIDGAALEKLLANPETIAAGVASGKPLDKAKKYKVAMPDFLYFGGSGFEVESLDPAPVESGMDWRAPIIAWTKKQASTDAAPLEKKLPK